MGMEATLALTLTLTLTLTAYKKGLAPDPTVQP